MLPISDTDIQLNMRGIMRRSLWLFMGITLGAVSFQSPAHCGDLGKHCRNSRGPFAQPEMFDGNKGLSGKALIGLNQGH